ncbi:MAG: archease [Isosphaeraceae bacterium]
MGTVELLDHTADVGLRVHADRLDDLFETAARGVFAYIVANPEEIVASQHESVALRADSPAELLAAWLNDLIFRSETRRRVYGSFRAEVAADGLVLHARIGGEAIDRDRHHLDHEVKAVTYHGLSLEREGDGWLAEFLLDI